MSQPETHNRRDIILMVVLNLEFGGQEKMIVDLSRCLHRRDIKVSVCCLDNAGPLAEYLREDGIPVFTLQKGPGFSVSASRQLRRIILEQNVSVVHSHNSPGLIYSAIALYGIRRRVGVVHVNTRHGDVAIEQRGRVLNRLANRSANKVVAVSEDLKKSLSKIEKIRPDKSEVIINGVDMTPFENVPAHSESEYFPVIAHVARLSNVKNQKMLLNVFARFVAKFPDAKLLLIGDGPDRAMLQNYTDDLQLGESVEFLGMRQDIPRYLGMSHWFALSSLSEGTPMSILEAMAAGRAVTSTDVGGIGKLVAHEENGMLSPRGDESAMLHNWLTLAQSPEMLRRLGEQARMDARADFSADRMTDKYLRVYRNRNE